MADMQGNYRRTFKRPGTHHQPHKPKRQRRTSLILVPLALLFAAWILNRAQPAIRWQDILYLTGVRDPERFSMLVVLVLTCIALLLIKRIVKRR